ncbi:MAG: serine/threonine-protein phosphatase, partial [Armatimonadetes bacterium]|nr:serine/threonine-protein phosphatase [Armatimonadota bacterium]
QGRLHTLLYGTGGPLGADENWDYENRIAFANKGDLLLLYTDGATDTQVGDAPLGIEGLEKIVFEAGHCKASELIDRVCSYLSSDGANHIRRDDIALLAVSFEKMGQAESTGLVMTGGLGGKDFVARCR